MDGSPDNWYTSDIWCYGWLPLTHQYVRCREDKMLSIRSFPCIQCDTQNCLEVNSYHWCTMFCMDKITWVLHPQFLCHPSNHTFAGIDPVFISQLPTCVASQFSFVTTRSGFRMHTSMIFAFLTTNKVFFGTYVNMIHELYCIKYDICQVNYLDTAGE